MAAFLAFACYVFALASNTFSLLQAAHGLRTAASDHGRRWWSAAIGANFLVYVGIVALAMTVVR